MKIKLLVMLLAAIAITSCQSGKKVADSGKSSLKNVKWGLTALEGQNIDSAELAKDPYIIFLDDGSFNGNFGCNKFFGNYYQKKQKIELTYQGATKMLCSDMNLERAMMKSLKKEIKRFDIDGKTLILYEGKNEVMRFEDRGPVVESEQ